MDPRITLITLGVSDLERSVAFYRDGLGLPRRDGPEGLLWENAWNPHFSVADGPAIDSPEQPGGYDIIEAESMDEALEWARKGRFMPGSNEVIPLLSAEG